jgi:hypothetical protein
MMKTKALPKRETKERKTFTMAPTVIARLAKASQQTGLSESSYVEQAVRLKLSQDGIE